MSHVALGEKSLPIPAGYTDVTTAYITDIKNIPAPTTNSFAVIYTFSFVKGSITPVIIIIFDVPTYISTVAINDIAFTKKFTLGTTVSTAVIVADKASYKLTVPTRMRT